MTATGRRYTRPAVRTPLSAPWRAFVGRLAVAVALVFSLTAGSIGGAYWIANERVNAIEKAEIAPGAFDELPVGKGKAGNFLIIGSDTRAFVSDDRDAESFGDPVAQAGQRSDTIMIAHVDPETESGLLVSFPRDLWVEIPGLGGSRINAAFNEGPQRVIKTIQQNFDIPIHHYLEVDFAGFRGMVNAIGTVPVFFPTPARDKMTGLEIPLGGCVALNGDQALAYARSRYYEWYDAEDRVWRSDPTSDFGRIRRQQYFLRSLAQAGIEKAGRNPVKAYRLLDEVVKHLVKDEALGLSDLQALAGTFRNVDPAAVEMLTVPTVGARRGAAAVLELVDDEAEPIFERLRRFGEPQVPDDAPPPPDAAPADVRVQVLNGSGVAGIAGSTLDSLHALGFAGIDPPGDADRLDYAATEIRYAPGAEGHARLVKAYLAGAGTLVPLDEAPAAADVVLVLGRDFEGVYAPGTAPTTTAAPTTTTTIPPNPGTLPGLRSTHDPNSGLPLVGC